MNAQQIKDIKDKIDSSTNIEVLAKFITNEQYKYWYDPCGKSGHEFDDKLTLFSIRALRRVGKLMGLEK